MLGLSRKRFALRHRGTLIPPSGGSDVVSFDIGSAGEAIVLWSDGDSAAATVHGLDREPVTLREALPEFPKAQTLPDGRLLAVGARSEWRDGVGENNAFVYGPDGSVERAACLGDGIEHVQTTADGAVWVGYFDEGVYGNLGWGEPGGVAPIGAPGLVQFSPSLDVEWQFSSEEAPIDDCYALNVIDTDVWACYYSDFDVIRVRDGLVRSWTNDVGGARAIVVSGESVALFGGYAKDYDRLVIGVLEGDELHPDVTARLTMPNGRQLPKDAVVVGRGDELHVRVGLDWLTWSLADHA
jgi:hypothetical protein